MRSAPGRFAPPTEEQRSTLLRLVLDLNVETMAFGREFAPKPG